MLSWGVLPALAVAMVACTSNAPMPAPEESISWPVGVTGASAMEDPSGDVRLDRGEALIDSVDIIEARIDSDGLILTATVRFVGGVPEPRAGRALGCQVHMETDTGARFLIDMDRRTSDPGDYWSIGRSSPELELDQELHPLVVRQRSVEARIPLYLLRGLTPTFGWDVSCTYADEGSRSMDTAGPERFEGVVEQT